MFGPVSQHGGHLVAMLTISVLEEQHLQGQRATGRRMAPCAAGGVAGFVCVRRWNMLRGFWT